MNKPKLRHSLLLTLGLLGSGIAIAGCASATSSGPPARAVTVARITTSIVIDPQVGEVFEPAPASAAPALTAQQVWAKYATLIGAKTTAIPAHVTVELGLLTLPIGPSGPKGIEIYTAYRQLTYGYSTHACPKSMNPHITSLPANPCIYWDFLNANTGRQIDSTYQQ